jgi:ATP-dependent Clp protease adaptor protein ClpS
MTPPLATPDIGEDLDVVESPGFDPDWQTVVWNDPVNLMSYVVHVFRSYFGYSEGEATRLMRGVHNDGHAVVAQGMREQMELHAQAMHDFGLWATVRRAPSA